jgi:hypothetical protein
VGLAVACRLALYGWRRGPVFPDSVGGWRDPSNTSRDFVRRGSTDFDRVTSHVFLYSPFADIYDGNPIRPAGATRSQIGMPSAAAR